jgi:hypothetical protein
MRGNFASPLGPLSLKRPSRHVLKLCHNLVNLEFAPLPLLKLYALMLREWEQ